MSSQNKRGKKTGTAPAKPSNTLFNYFPVQETVNEKRTADTAFQQQDAGQQTKKVKLEAPQQAQPKPPSTTSGFVQLPTPSIFSPTLLPPVQSGVGGSTQLPGKQSSNFFEISKQKQLEAALSPMLHLQKGTPTESHDAFKSLFNTKGATKGRYQGYDLNDQNNARLIKAIKDNKKAYKNAKDTDFEKKAGFINEARMLDRTLRKYNQMDPIEQAKRQYYPQTTIGSPTVQGNRRPDLLKIKTTDQGTFATFTEVKTKEFQSNQRQDTLKILQDTKTISAQPQGVSGPSPVDLTKTPVTKYKTVFAGSFSKKNPDHPTDPGVSLLTPRLGGKATLSGTGIAVYSKRPLDK
ncbi:hypothetical protein N8I74_04050 [Chitiniphilus purpureus]|uniref:Uncharacterized protein n=1 Tax=Chitiniphilus purpureus TaxID=2981137 RepID=A0ABY6DQ91_9NEIS|nr:hypothetical protein [Chitiniphilus sp. CD1]UXY16202.1 hypothetical protein N8I74_04050 [Chitiniphilus sp. CD1]